MIDARHRPWAVACAAILAVATLFYVHYARAAVDGPRGSSWPGLLFGGAGLALMLYAGLLGLRRKVPTWRVGRAATWMKGHLWLGLLSVPLVLFHAGFQLGGPLTMLLMVLFTIVVLSGIFGIVAQQFLPRLMTAQIPYETIYEQIDSVVAQLDADAEAVVAAACGPLETAARVVETAPRGGGGLPRGQASPLSRPRRPAASGDPLPGSQLLKDVYLVEIHPFLQKDLPRAGRLVTPAGASVLFQQLRTSLGPLLEEAVSELEEICRERGQLAQQKRLHHWLHGWLFVHVPLSAALILLAVVHAVMSLRY